MSAYWVGVFYREMQSVRAEEALIETERRQVGSGLMKKEQANEIISRWRKEVQPRKGKRKGAPSDKETSADLLGLPVRKKHG